MRKIIITIGIIILVVIGVLTFHASSISKQTAEIVRPTVVVSRIQNNTFSYKGENGKDALTLLKQRTGVEQDHSGLVVSIDGKKADNTKHEYWAFYINGKLAPVGPAQYVTKNSDVIMWKIEKY